jgi:hypothetical protein
MPLSPEKLLGIVREDADKANCLLTWKLDNILAALCIIFGGAQFKDLLRVVIAIHFTQYFTLRL